MAHRSRLRLFRPEAHPRPLRFPALRAEAPSAPVLTRLGDNRIPLSKTISRHRHGHSSCRDKRHKQDLYLSPAARRPSPEAYGAMLLP
jgi:hypothetical protein